MTHKDIIAEYEKAEFLAGGLANCDPDEVCETVAKTLKIPSSEVRSVMLNAWAMIGGG